MSSIPPRVGARIILLSKKNIRYEGTLLSLDHENHSLTLSNVLVLGTEDRKTPTGGTVAVRSITEPVTFNAADIQSCQSVKRDSPTTTTASTADTTTAGTVSSGMTTAGSAGGSTTANSQVARNVAVPASDVVSRGQSNEVDSLTGNMQNLSFGRGTSGAQKTNGAEAQPTATAAVSKREPTPPKNSSNAARPLGAFTPIVASSAASTSAMSGASSPTLNVPNRSALGAIGDSMLKQSLPFEEDRFRAPENAEIAPSRSTYDHWGSRDQSRGFPGGYLASGEQSQLYSPWKSGPSDPWAPSQSGSYDRPQERNGGSTWENTQPQEERDRFAPPPHTSTHPPPRDSFYDREFREPRDDYRYEPPPNGDIPHNNRSGGSLHDFSGGGRDHRDYTVDDRGRPMSSSSSFRDAYNRSSRPTSSYVRHESPRSGGSSSRAMESANWRRDSRWGERDGTRETRVYQPERREFTAQPSRQSWEQGRFPSNKRDSPAWRRPQSDRRPGQERRPTHRQTRSASYRPNVGPGTGGFLDQDAGRRNRRDFRDTPDDEFDFETSLKQFDKEAFASQAKLQYHGGLEFPSHIEEPQSDIQPRHPEEQPQHQRSPSAEEDQLPPLQQEDDQREPEQPQPSQESQPESQPPANGNAQEEVSSPNAPNNKKSDTSKQVYDKTKSFFDDISTDPKRSRVKMRELRKVDTETFGDIAEVYQSRHHRNNAHRRNYGGNRRYNNYQSGGNYRGNNYRSGGGSYHSRSSSYSGGGYNSYNSGGSRYRGNNRQYRPRGSYESRDFDRRRNSPRASED